MILIHDLTVLPLPEEERRAILEKPLGHGFGEAIPDRECRGMHQFGG